MTRAALYARYSSDIDGMRAQTAESRDWPAMP